MPKGSLLLSLTHGLLCLKRLAGNRIFNTPMLQAGKIARLLHGFGRCHVQVSSQRIKGWSRKIAKPPVTLWTKMAAMLFNFRREQRFRWAQLTPVQNQKPSTKATALFSLDGRPPASTAVRMHATSSFPKLHSESVAKAATVEPSLTAKDFVAFQRVTPTWTLANLVKRSGRAKTTAT